MKTGKKLIALAAVGAAVVSLGALAACEPKTPDDGKTPGGDTTPQIAYQFTGEFTNDTLSGYGFAYGVMLNLWDDNKVTGSGYNYLTLDTRTAAENKGFSEKWFRGSWEVSKDDEDQDCIKLKVIYDADAKNSMTGATLSNTSTYFLYKKTGSEELSDFRLQSPIFSGTTEYMTNMSQNANPYKTADEFIKAYEYRESLPTGSLALFETTGQTSSRIYLMPEGKALCYSGRKDSSNNVKYIKGETWKWTYIDGALKIISTSNNTETAYDATVTGNSATLEYSVNLMGNVMEYSYACSDISKLSPSQGGENPPVEEKTPIATLTAADNKTVKFYDDGTAKAEAGYLSPEWRWEKSGNTIAFKNKDDDNAPNGLTFTVSGNTGTLVYAPSFLQGQSITYTGDVSTLLA